MSIFSPIQSDRKNFSVRVVEYIKELILKGELKEGDKLPPERELAQLLNVSRPTIREAYKILSSLGFLNIKHGQGVFVASHRDRIKSFTSTFFLESDTIFDLFEIRRLLETEAAAWAAKRGDPKVIEKLFDVVHEALELANQEPLDYKKLLKKDEEFHLGLAESSGNSVMMRIMHDLIDLFEKSRIHSILIPGRGLQSVKEHLSILEAVKAKDDKLAKKRMMEHLESVEKTVWMTYGQKKDMKFDHTESDQGENR